MNDFDLEIKNTQPINMEDMHRCDNNVKKSIILYNKAIEEIKIKDLNSAIEDLKKALSYNEDFPEGIKLLGLCYANDKKYKKAEKAFKELVEYEEYSHLAKEYIKNSIVERTLMKTMKSMERHEDSSKGEKKKSDLNNHPKRKLIIGLSAIGVLIAVFTISYLVGIKMQIDSKKAQATNKVADTSKEKIDKVSEKDKSLDKKDAPLDEDDKNINKKLDNTKSEVDNNKDNALSMVKDTEKFYKEGNEQQTEITGVDTKNTKPSDGTKLNSDKLNSDIKTKNKWDIYNEGNRLYKQGKYGEALPKLKMAYEIQPSAELMPWITYQIGNSYKETNDNANALVFFQKVKDNYPNSQYVSSSERMINQIKNRTANGD
ncbi:tetratricopeptide repeat protein [Clostridium bovifaecis]|uniref:Tetratricopeptide repeat protein n=1 Tax=Clostridium bovifaecis TaxID=2184719 RepID=A0A6I6F1D3_9CLOT|nr:tetratricopeptide repeat protein [Clostridium bovifaecis]